MDMNNWSTAASVGEAATVVADWRVTLQADSRQRIVNKIMGTLKMHLPFSGEEGLQELKKCAVRFEEKIYTAATSQSDYLRKISLKMLSMESKSQPLNSAVDVTGTPLSTPLLAEFSFPEKSAVSGKSAVTDHSAVLVPVADIAAEDSDADSVLEELRHIHI